MNARYIIGTGWWCAETTSQGVERPLAKGSDIIRSQPFHHLWHASISEFTDPCAIIMIDSASPVPPPLKANSKLHVLSLPSNPGHSSQCTTRYCGWTASVLLGVEYALMCNVEYYVYVEQDVLLKGKNIVERCIERMTTPYMFGDGTGTPQPIQQSLFIIRRDGMPSFLSAMHGLKSSDSVINPEWKFQIATSPFLIRFPEQLLSQRTFRRFYTRHQKKIFVAPKL